MLRFSNNLWRRFHTFTSRPARAAQCVACAILMALRLSIAHAAPSPALLALLRIEERRVATIGFRLAVANGDLCGWQMPWPGLSLHAAAQYRPADRPVVSSYFHLADRPAILAIVADGPADRAGLREDDRLLAINGISFSPAREAAPSYEAVGGAMSQIEDQLAKGPAMLSVARPDGSERKATLQRVMGCRSVIQFRPQGRIDAEADGTLLIVNASLVEFTASDDELAVAIGHEMAHNVLGHQAQLSAAKVDRGLARILPGNARRIRITEVEADYLGLYLTARAGYDIGVAPAFWRRFGRAGGDSSLSDGTHPSGRARAEAAKQAIAEIAAKRAAGRPLLPDADRLTWPPTADTIPRTAAPPH